MITLTECCKVQHFPGRPCSNCRKKDPEFIIPMTKPDGEAGFWFERTLDEFKSGLSEIIEVKVTAYELNQDKGTVTVVTSIGNSSHPITIMIQDLRNWAASWKLWVQRRTSTVYDYIGDETYYFEENKELNKINFNRYLSEDLSGYHLTRMLIEKNKDFLKSLITKQPQLT